ncbi:MAG: response regulator [Deltaproteobacteria bacterium]|nr:response regulator [Deltaproteobacteria bacterium]
MGLSGSGEAREFKILIVEDNATFRQAFKENLQLVGPDIIIQEAVDAEECLEKAEAFRPHLIFMDIRVPGESGLSLTKKIKALYPAIQVIVMSSYDNLEYQEAALQFGASRFLTKDTLTLARIKPLILEDTLSHS